MCRTDYGLPSLVTHASLDLAQLFIYSNWTQKYLYFPLAYLATPKLGPS
jgi:hypothetical protein